jgi:hypothetical protein
VHRPVIGALLLVAAVAATAALFVRWRPAGAEGPPARPAAPRGQPTTWRMAGNSLTVFGETGAVLFVHRFAFRLGGGSCSSESPPAVVGPLPVVIDDVDGDGRNEVLASPTAEDRANRKLYCPDGVTGFTPAVRPAYACRNCAPGGPESVFLFPTLCINRRRGQAGVYDVWVEKGERLRVAVAQGGASAGSQTPSYYTLGPDGRVVSAEISREFQAEHALLEKQGVLAHPFGPRDERDMLPVLRWDGTGFRPLPGVAVTR